MIEIFLNISGHKILNTLKQKIYIQHNTLLLSLTTQFIQYNVGMC